MSASSFSPLVQLIEPAPDPLDVFVRLAAMPHCVFLDSAALHPHLGRYSFIAADPIEWLTDADDSPSLGRLAARLADWSTPAVAGLPPFQGGAAGLLGYELGHRFERLPFARLDEFRVPAMAVGLYDVVVAFDHVQGRCWVISQGLPEMEPAARQRRAQRRLAAFVRWITDSAPPSPVWSQAVLPPLRADELAPQFALAGLDPLTSDFSRDAYLRAVSRAIEYIYAGDVFQVNLSQRLLRPAACDSSDLYLRLRRLNPAPFAGYFDLGDFQVISASPERFLRVDQGQVETRPIKGTRRRTGDPKRDTAIAAELQSCAKDRAENVMIVDLMRNDLARVCRPASVRVADLCGVEAYEHVLHLVSTVHGQLRPDRSPIDLLQAAFPGGSVTGAPKIRAMEIIAELEPTARGPYCGSLGYLGLDGSMDLSILIRTITAGRGWWQAPVGGGVVADSVPELEYQETLDKAEGLLRGMAASRNVS